MKKKSGFPISVGFPVECSKKCGMAVLEWLVRQLNFSFGMGLYLWTGVVIVYYP